jgi:hypothetical protein
MQRLLKKTVILMLLPLAAACAAGGDDAGGLDWSKSTTYNVKTGKGDRIAMRVLGNAADGYDYHARIRHMTRSDPDPLDRQRVLSEAMRVIVAKLCSAGAKEARPQYASNNYERIGRFTCTKG